MDIEPIIAGIGLFSTAVNALKQAISLIPDSSQKADAEAALEQAERKFKLAEAKTAKHLGYEICRKHFPPEVMLSENDTLWECPQCGNKKDTGPAGVIVDPPPTRKSRWRL